MAVPVDLPNKYVAPSAGASMPVLMPAQRDWLPGEIGVKPRSQHRSSSVAHFPSFRFVNALECTLGGLLPVAIS
jgi:hypothetical protein